MNEEVKILIDKYNRNEISETEKSQLEQLIEKGEVEITDLKALEQLENDFNTVTVPEPTEKLDQKFYDSLASKMAEKSSSGKSWFISLFQANPSYQLAYSIVLIVLGFVGGYFINNQQSPNEDIKQLSEEVNSMKEMMLLSLLEKESISDRLKAVNLTSELPKASQKVTDALFKTLNNDENVNVRLATLEALGPYLNNADVRQRLIASIAKQDSPLVQVAMAELMVNIQEDRSVDALQELLKKDSTPPEIKDRIKESIDILI